MAPYKRLLIIYEKVSMLGAMHNLGIVNLSPCLYNRRLVCDICRMNTPALPDHYKHHRFPIEIISHGVWLYFRFCLS